MLQQQQDGFWKLGGTLTMGLYYCSCLPIMFIVVLCLDLFSTLTLTSSSGHVLHTYSSKPTYVHFWPLALEAGGALWSHCFPQLKSTPSEDCFQKGLSVRSLFRMSWSLVSCPNCKLAWQPFGNTDNWAAQNFSNFLWRDKLLIMPNSSLSYPFLIPLLF